MKIVIDLQGAQTHSRYRGIGRYALSISQAIARNRGDDEIFLLLSAQLQENIQEIKEAFLGLVQPQNIIVFSAPTPLKYASPKNKQRQAIAQLMREELLNILNPDVVLITSLFEGFGDDATTSVKTSQNNFKTAVILYDLIPYIYPEHYLSNELIKEYYTSKITHLKKADILFAISNSSKQEAHHYLDFDTESIINISSAISDIFRPKLLAPYEKQKLFFRYAIEKKFIMYAPGGFDYRKNIKTLLSAYALLPTHIRQNYQLLISSNIGSDKKQEILSLASSLGIQESELLITGYISDEDLIALYNLTTLFVFPSLHEGFGLPLLEAMSCGAAVIGSNSSSIPEVIQREDALFDPNNPQELSALMADILEHPSKIQELKQHSLKIAATFSWDKSAQTLLNALHATIKPKEPLLTQASLNLEPFKKLIAEQKLSTQDTLLLSTFIARNTPKQKKHTIYVDITVLNRQDYGTGIQRVVRSVINELFKAPIDGYDLVLVHFEKQNDIYRCLSASAYQSKLTSQPEIIKDEIIEPKNGDIFFGLDLVSDVMYAHKQGLFKQYKAQGVTIKFVVYDILPILYPHWWPEGGSSHHAQWLQAIADVADELISISSAVNDEVQAYLLAISHPKAKHIKYSYFHLGADIASSLPSKGIPEGAQALLSVLNTSPTFLMVGTIEPRKGHLQTLKAFDILWKQNCNINLVIVGKAGWLVEETVSFIKNHSQYNKKLFWFDSISDEFLEKLYTASSALIAASEAEGFGLPLIEAAKHSLPIIARDIPVFKEVATSYAYYFANTSSPQELSQSLNAWLELYKTASHTKTSGMPYLNWSQSVSALKELLVTKKTL